MSDRTRTPSVPPPSRIELDATDRRLVQTVRTTRDEISAADWGAAPVRARTAAIGRLLSTLDVLLAILSDGQAVAEDDAETITEWGVRFPSGAVSVPTGAGRTAAENLLATTHAGELVSRTTTYGAWTTVAEDGGEQSAAKHEHQAPTLSAGVAQLLGAIREAVDIPRPSALETDQRERARLLTIRAADVRIIIEGVLQGRAPARAAELLREDTARHPVTYAPFRPEQQDGGEQRDQA